MAAKSNTKTATVSRRASVDKNGIRRKAHTARVTRRVVDLRAGSGSTPKQANKAEPVMFEFRMNPTPGQYFQPHVHAANFVEGVTPCAACRDDSKLEFARPFEINVDELTDDAKDLLDASRTGQNGVTNMPGNLVYERTRDYGEIIDAGEYPEWEKAHVFLGGSLEKFRATRDTYFPHGMPVYGGSTQSRYTPSQWLNEMAAKNTAGGWRLKKMAE